MPSNKNIKKSKYSQLQSHILRKSRKFFYDFSRKEKKKS